MDINSNLTREIDFLTKQLQEKDKNLITSAQYGKNLLEEHSLLREKFEKLIQEHSAKEEVSYLLIFRYDILRILLLVKIL